jgi:uncharacterized membrane protein HdeD (DUF308 family)
VNLNDPATIAFLGLLASVVAGAVQATRAARVDSRWLPLVSGAWGVVITVLAAYTPGTPISGVPVAGAVLAGLFVGFGTTGLVTVATHWGVGSTNGSSTESAAARRRV